MCGRYVRYEPLTAWVEMLGGSQDADLFDWVGMLEEAPRYNIAPGEDGWIIMFDENGSLVVDERRWVFTTPRGPGYCIRVESARRAAAYRDAFNRRRCVVLANGFYAPMDAGIAERSPWAFITRRDEAPLFLGGMSGPDGFSILTRKLARPFDSVSAPLPVCVAEDDMLDWLAPDVTGTDALRHCAPRGLEAGLAYWRVDAAVAERGREGRKLTGSALLRAIHEATLPEPTCELPLPPV